MPDLFGDPNRRPSDAAAEWPATRSNRPRQKKHAARHHQAIDTRNNAYKQVMREEQGSLLDPETLDGLGNRQARVYRCIVGGGAEGKTNDEISAATGLAINVVTPRTYELRGEGANNPLAERPLVVPLRDNGATGGRVKRETSSGSTAQVWVAVAVLEAPSATDAPRESIRVSVRSPTPRQPAERRTLRVTIR